MPRLVKLDSTDNYFLVRHGAAIALPSLKYFCFPRPDSLMAASNASFHVQFPRPGPLPNLAPQSGTADEHMRVFLLRESLLQDADLVTDQLQIGRYINPSVVAWRGHLVKAAANSWEVQGSSNVWGGADYNDRIEMHCVLANSSWSQLAAATVTGPTTPLNLTAVNDVDGPGLGILGQDPRLLVVDDGVMLVASTWRFGAKIKMGLAVLLASPPTPPPTAPAAQPEASQVRVRVAKVLKTLVKSKGPQTDEKNWSPFMHGGEVHFIQSINPFRVVKLERQVLDLEALALAAGAPDQSASVVKEEEAVVVPAETLEHHYANLSWLGCDYGHLRGGSNAVLLPSRGVFISLFHSSTMIPGNPMKTYLFGALTFSAAPPFRLLSLSPRPIADPKWFDGPWDHIKNRRIDYIAFPMAISLLSSPEDTLLVSFGRQDYQGWIGKINVARLLETLESVLVV